MVSHQSEGRKQRALHGKARFQFQVFMKFNSYYKINNNNNNNYYYYYYYYYLRFGRHSVAGVIFYILHYIRTNYEG